MKRFTLYRSLLALVVGALTLLGLVPVSPALAAPPQIITIPIDETWGFNDCGFAIVGHNEGTVRIIGHLDANGNMEWVQVLINTRDTVTNPATGESLSTPNVGLDTIRFEADGSVTVAHIGILARFVVPGEGLVGARVGRLVIRIAEGSPPELVFHAGQYEPNLRAVLCRVLGE